MSSWHRFVVTSDDDNECVNPDCGAVVSDDAMRAFMVDCPVQPCRDVGNDGGCVFVPSSPGPECSYCGQPGDNQERERDDEDVTLGV